MSKTTIFYFAKGQAELRQVEKTPDWHTVESAMLAKLSDVKKTLKRGYVERSKKRSQLLEEYGDRKQKMKRCIRQITTAVQKEKC